MPVSTIFLYIEVAQSEYRHEFFERGCMKQHAALSLVLIGLFLSGCSGGDNTAGRLKDAENPYAILDPYGVWVDMQDIGRVWRPTVANDWRPFFDGRWEWTDRGWLWVSEEPYGWLVYHYGSWFDAGGMGWVWVPGDEWSPARVRWIQRDDMIGWAPLPPSRMTLPEAYEAGGENIWICVPPQHFARPDIGRYRTSPAGTRLPDDARRPPDVRAIERATNQRIDRQRTDMEEVRVGNRSMIRVRVGQRSDAGIDAGRRPENPPPAISLPPPAVFAPVPAVPAPVVPAPAVPAPAVPAPAVPAQPSRPRPTPQPPAVQPGGRDQAPRGEKRNPNPPPVEKSAKQPATVEPEQPTKETAKPPAKPEKEKEAPKKNPEK